MVEKKFRLQGKDIKPLATNLGACFATDLITVDGHLVGFMYREEPDNDIDSGWRFLAGIESVEYMDNSANMAVYDVNTLANYDPAIIPFLNSPKGSAFERIAGSHKFREVEYQPE